MSNLQKEELNKMELRALKEGDMQILRLLKEIRTQREAYGAQRSQYVKNKAAYGLERQREVERAFGRGANAVRKLFPSLPALTVDNAAQKVTLYITKESPERRAQLLEEILLRTHTPEELENTLDSLRENGDE